MPLTLSGINWFSPDKKKVFTYVTDFTVENNASLSGFRFLKFPPYVGAHLVAIPQGDNPTHESSEINAWNYDFGRFY